MAVIVARGSSWPFVNDSDRALGYREGLIAEDEGNSCGTLCRLLEKAICSILGLETAVLNGVCCFSHRERPAMDLQGCKKDVQWLMNCNW